MTHLSHRPLVQFMIMLAAFVASSLPFALADQTSTAPSASDERPESPARTKLTEPVVVPIEIVDEQPTVEVRINGQGPYRFIFDTGAAGCGRVNRDLADALQLKVVDQVETGDPSGKNGRIVDRVHVDSISIGGATFDDMRLLRRDESAPRGGAVAGEQYQGIIGIRLFADCLVTIDYPARKLRIERGALPDGDPHTVDYEPRHGAVHVKLDVAGKSIGADVDSGAMGGIMLPESMAKELPMAGELKVVGRARTNFNEFDIKSARVDGVLRLAGHELPEPQIEFAEIFPHANIGGQVLQLFVVTIDQAHHRVRFARNDAGPIRMSGRYSLGIMLRPQPDALVVEDVAPGRPAERAGIHKGDRIVKLNGRRVADLKPGEPRELMGKPEVLKITVERDGQTIELEATPQAMDS